MDEATRKALEDAYSQLMRAAKNIRRLLDGETSQRLAQCDLHHASIAGVMLPDIVQKPADASSRRD
jgi:hypothetical protein